MIVKAKLYGNIKDGEYIKDPPVKFRMAGEVGYSVHQPIIFLINNEVFGTIEDCQRTSYIALRRG